MLERKATMGKGLFIGASLALLAATAAQAQDVAQPAARSPAVQSHIDAAHFLNKDLPTTLFPNLLSAMPNSGLPRNTNKSVAPFTKVFDQFYFIGLGSVGSWVLNTKDGIIQFDTLNNADEAEHIILAGYKQLGLDPARVKYIVISHGHADHYGGARYLQDHMAGAKVVMSAADYDLAERRAKGPRANGVPAPRRDLVATDGEKLTLGNTSVTLYITPGHTPGTLSAIIPVTDHGKHHMIGFWGGTGYPGTFTPTQDSGGLDAYKESLLRFTKLAVDAGVDTPISNHSEIDGSFEKAQMMKSRKAGEPNPFVLGQSTYIRFMGVIYDFMQASMALAREKGAT
jgi:metallo-beta-lactamase class B